MKQGLEPLAEYAQKNKVDMAFYGHTHRMSWEIVNGIYLINPGNLISTPRQMESTLALIELNGDDNRIDFKRLIF